VKQSNSKPLVWPILGVASAAVVLTACVTALPGAKGNTGGSAHALVGDFFNPAQFDNPYSHIPAQCYIETSHGAQNACQFCHTNGVYELGLGNNLPQAGAEPRLGNLQLEYSFAPHRPFEPLSVVNPWENTLKPEKLLAAVRALGQDPHAWGASEVASYVRQDNWSAAFSQRPGSAKDWDSAVNHPMRLFPGLAPADLPAQADGFVRSPQASRGYFKDDAGWLTGWRAVNFMPYGIFTPMTGSVSGIYIRLPQAFMRDASGQFNLGVYQRNLDLLERAIQDRLTPADGQRFTGQAHKVPLRRGEYPVGTEFAHPLHYVDVAADGSRPDISRFPGTRAQRVKEIRYMMKWKDFHHADFRPGEKEEGLPVYGHATQGWVDNGVGWYLAGYIEDALGSLRPQTPQELTQCIGCHSGVVRTEQSPSFTSGTGNTVDSTWAMARKWPGSAGWREMDYLGYQAVANTSAQATPGQAKMGDPFNRGEGKGELRYFLDNVVGASLYGDMPAAIERYLAQTIRTQRGYSADWPTINTRSPQAFTESQTLRQRLMRDLTARGEHLNAHGRVRGALLYPPMTDALAGASRYRQVVVSQRYHLGKDVFPTTPVNFTYLRDSLNSFTHLDGQTYHQGEVITDRSVHRSNPAADIYLVGNVPTLIDEKSDFAQGGTYNPRYVPLLSTPLRFENK
jgi:hypothetical protein